MRKTRLRNALLLTIAALSASLEAPRLVQQPLGSTTTELAKLADAPDAISNAVRNVVRNVTESHLGFDTNVYPGDRAMDAWKRSDYEWVGYYLPAPCHKDDSWTGNRARLEQKGWGLAVIYVGQQTWGKRLPTAAQSTKSTASATNKSTPATGAMSRTSTTPVAAASADCSASLVGSAQGVADARDAILKTQREGFAKGSVIFLDLEYMDVVPQRMRDYYRAWARTVLADGRYRPGVYAHTRNAASIYSDVNQEYAWAGVDEDPPFWVAGSKGFSPYESAPADVGHTFASAWQGTLDVVRTHNGVKLPIDISVAAVASPSSAVQQAK